MEPADFTSISTLLPIPLSHRKTGDSMHITRAAVPGLLLPVSISSPEKAIPSGAAKAGSADAAPNWDFPPAPPSGPRPLPATDTTSVSSKRWTETTFWSVKAVIPIPITATASSTGRHCSKWKMVTTDLWANFSATSISVFPEEAAEAPLPLRIIRPVFMRSLP